MNILVFAGTKNGRLLVEELANNNHKVYASSISEHGANLITKHKMIHCLVGKMTVTDIVAFTKFKDIHLIVDSTHPYAKEISINIQEANLISKVKSIRLERESSISSEVGKHFDDFDSVLNYLQTVEGNVLFTTGVNEVFKMLKNLDKSRVYLRIVPMKSSVDKINKAGLDHNQVVQKQPPFTLEDNLNHINSFNIKYVVTKDSGKEGNTKEKIMATNIKDCQLLVIDRPKMTYPIIFYTNHEVFNYINQFVNIDSLL